MNALLNARRPLRRPTNQLLTDMLLYAAKAHAFAMEVEQDELQGDLVRHMALERVIGIVGKAASLVPRSYRDEHPEIPWRELVRRWRVLITTTKLTDAREIWRVGAHDMPELIAALEPLVDAPPKG